MKDNLISTIHLLCDYMKTSYTSKKHGGYNIYEDDKIRLCLDTYVPNIDVYVKTDGENHLVLSRGYHGHNQIYHPGAWEQHILSLRPKALQALKTAQKIRKQKEEEEQLRKYGPVPEKLNEVFK